MSEPYEVKYQGMRVATSSFGDKFDFFISKNSLFAGAIPVGRPHGFADVDLEDLNEWLTHTVTAARAISISDLRKALHIEHEPDENCTDEITGWWQKFSFGYDAEKREVIISMAEEYATQDADGKDEWSEVGRTDLGSWPIDDLITLCEMVETELADSHRP